MNGQPTDIDLFFQNIGIISPILTPVLVGGATNNFGVPKHSDEDAEVALDIDVAGCVANGAQLAVYFAPWTQKGWVDVITTAIFPGVGQPTPSVLSISWGSLEDDWTAAAINAINATFQAAATVGVTLFVASGDDGTDGGRRTVTRTCRGLPPTPG